MSDKKIKVLILAYDFPPYVSVGGLRPFSWYQYLPEFDIYPIVITRQWSNKHGNHLDYIESGGSQEKVIETSQNGTIIRTPYIPNYSNRLMLKHGETKYKFLRKFITAYYELAQFLFTVGPKSQLYFAADEYLEKNKVDFIIACADPFILFDYASKLSSKFHIPWIADYRDPWSQNFKSQEYYLLKVISSYFEKKIVKNTELITTVSEFVKLNIGTLIKDKSFFILPNGYSPELIEGIHDIKQQNEKLSIAFVGTIYEWYPIKSFLRVVSDFVNTNPEAQFQVNFYGTNMAQEISDLLETDFVNIKNHINIFPKIPNAQLLQELAKNHVMLLFNTFCHMGTKIYDYIGIRRKMIFCYSDDAEATELKKKYYLIDETFSLYPNLQEDLINETQSGIIVKDSAHLRIVLKDLYEEFAYHGSIACNSINTELFSRKIQVQKLSEIVHNLQKKKQVYQQCTRCVMDTSDPEITFDEKGYCNHCTEYFEKTSKLIYQGADSEIKLKQLVENIRKSGKNNDYDCVIGISGGVDSIYTAYLAKQLGLRVLTVHMDNGWNSELAVHNIEKILKKLEMELNTIVLNWEEFRDLQLSFLQASVPEAETPTDIAIPAALHKIAARHNIKYILSGGNYATEGILPKSWHYDAKDVKYLKSIHQRFGTKKLKTFPTFGFQKEIYYKYFKGIKMVYPLNYLSYNKKEAIHILEKELDWKDYGGKHHESIYTKFIQSYLLFEKFGIDYRRATYSTQICSGVMSREEALSEIIKKPYDESKLEEEKEYISKKLNITTEELNSIINQPAKSFRDYPNNQKTLEFIYDIYRKINRS